MCGDTIREIIVIKRVKGALAQLRDLLLPELLVRKVVLFDLWPVFCCFNISLGFLICAQFN